MSKEKQIEEMVKFVCMNCRYFMQCNDDTMCDGRTLSEILKEGCWTLKYAEKLYNKGYRKQSEGEWREDFDGDCYCTACGYYPKKDVKNFCPNCGAKMKGGAE